MSKTPRHPQVMVQSRWQDARPGDYFECYPDAGVFISVEFVSRSSESMPGYGNVTFMTKTLGGVEEHTGLAKENDTHVFIRRDIENGMPCTSSLNGDSYPCRVVGWSPSGHQVHVLWNVREGRPGEPRLETFTRRSNGRYFQKGSNGGFSLVFGVAESRTNPEF